MHMQAYIYNYISYLHNWNTLASVIAFYEINRYKSRVRRTSDLDWVECNNILFYSCK